MRITKETVWAGGLWWRLLIGVAIIGAAAWFFEYQVAWWSVHPPGVVAEKEE